MQEISASNCAIFSRVIRHACDQASDVACSELLRPVLSILSLWPSSFAAELFLSDVLFLMSTCAKVIIFSFIWFAFSTVTLFLQNGWSCSLQAVAVDMISSAAQSGSSISSGSICAQLIEELLRIASDNESHASIVSPALQASSALACTCSSDQVRTIMQMVLARLSTSSPMDSDLSVCLLHAAAFAIRRCVACALCSVSN